MYVQMGSKKEQKREVKIKSTNSFVIMPDSLFKIYFDLIINIVYIVSILLTPFV